MEMTMKDYSIDSLKRRTYRSALLLVLSSMMVLSVFQSGEGFAQLGQSASRKEPNTAANAPKYFALIIGNNKYQHLKRLNTAINDAESIESVLRQSYGFQTKLLRDAGREQIVDAINEYRRKLDEQSYLLIYYAGHGLYDRSIDAAYWLPVDARPDSDTRWISADDVTRNIKGIAATHVLVISDSCYSGMLKREATIAITPAERQRFIEKMREGRSRILIASGGDEPVDDGGGEGHSVFANALLKGLQRIESAEFTSSELFNGFILEQVAGRARQTPQYGVITNSGHDSGDFVFIKRGAVVSDTAATLPTPILPPSQEHEPQYYTEMVKGVAIEMVRIPSGKFLMGSPASELGRDDDEGPQHEVTISQSFYMGKYEVTQAQWRVVARLPKVKIDLNPDPSNFKGDGQPVEQVNWEEAVEFCERLSKASGKKYHLPTEAEWEYACRAGTTGAYAGELNAMAWYYNNSDSTTHAVGVKQPNNWGLYDMQGNVWEWCLDWFSRSYYSVSPSIDPQGPSSELFRVLRGGGWAYYPRDCRSADRRALTPGIRFNDLGFRLVRSYN